MNKIILLAGLLIFSLSLIYFGQRNLALTDVFIKSFVMFTTATISLAIMIILFIKSINNTSAKKNRELDKELDRK